MRNEVGKEVGMRFKSPWIEKKRKFQYNLVEEKRKELPMTKVVPISITISIEKGEIG